MCSTSRSRLPLCFSRDSYHTNIASFTAPGSGYHCFMSPHISSLVFSPVCCLPLSFSPSFWIPALMPYATTLATPPFCISLCADSIISQLVCCVVPFFGIAPLPDFILGVFMSLCVCRLHLSFVVMLCAVISCALPLLFHHSANRQCVLLSCLLIVSPTPFPSLHSSLLFILYCLLPFCLAPQRHVSHSYTPSMPLDFCTMHFSSRRTTRQESQHALCASPSLCHACTGCSCRFCSCRFSLSFLV